jgi:tetratricopeptide (TPR) repeat protein
MFREGERIELPDLAVGLELPTSKFTVRKVLRGGMGECAKIVHDSSGRVFALKIVNDAALRHSEAFERFCQEVKIWTSASTCDAVVQVFSVFRFNELPCVCSEWMEGGDLRGYVKRRDATFFYRTVDRVLAGLEWVHGTYRVIHRDLKPENILLDGQLNSYIADWGISRVLHVPTSEDARSRGRLHPPSTLTQTGQFIGTVMYSAPEQILGSKTIDHRADIYSIGCILHEWESGEPPFTGETPEQIAYHHLESPVPRIGGVFRRSKFGIEKIIARCLKKRPDDRYQTYAEFRSELRIRAQAQGVEFTPFNPQARRAMPLVGGEEVRRKGFKDAVVGSKGYAAVPLENILPYLTEAEVLCNVNEWQKAHDILIRLYIPEMISQFPDHDLHQRIVIDLGLCLSRMERASEAIDVLEMMSGAENKPPEYFINLTLALVQAHRDSEAERIARLGLGVYPKDADVLGNLTIALLGQKRNDDALEPAQRRLAISRDVHSLEELGMVHMALGHEVEDTDWPRAASEFAAAIPLLMEARDLNPQYVSARLNLAKARFHLEDFTAATSELESIGQLRLDKSLAELNAVMFAECLNRVAAFEQCLTFCDKWLKVLPDSIGLRRVRAETTADAYCIGKKKNGVRVADESAMEFFTNIIGDSRRRKPSDLRYLARLKEWAGEVKAAFALIAEAEQFQPKHWEDSFNRAVFYCHSGDLKSALYHAQKACTLGQWRPQVWRLVASIQNSLGQETDAKSSHDREKKVAQARIKVAQDAVAKILARRT